MTVFLAGAGLLLASFLVQLLIWRVALPRSQTVALLLIFAVVPPCVLATAALSGHALWLPAPETARLVLAYVAFTLAYVVLYSAIEHQSPTLAIISQVAKDGSRGALPPISTPTLRAKIRCRTASKRWNWAGTCSLTKTSSR